MLLKIGQDILKRSYVLIFLESAAQKTLFSTAFIVIRLIFLSLTEHVHEDDS